MERMILEGYPGPNRKLRLTSIRDHLAENIRLNPSNKTLQERLLEVDAALDRLAKDRYGLCEICGTEIDPQLSESIHCSNTVFLTYQQTRKRKFFGLDGWRTN